MHNEEEHGGLDAGVGVAGDHHIARYLDSAVLRISLRPCTIIFVRMQSNPRYY